MFFSSKLGGVVCEKCNDTLHLNTSMHYKIRDFLNTLVQCDFDYKSDYEDKVTEKVCTVCFELLKNYITEHSSSGFKSTNVLQTV